MDPERRKFIKTSMAAAMGMAISPLVLAQGQPLGGNFRICIFSKSLQFLDYDLMAELVAELGFDGVDLTVRKDGHVSAENVGVELPKMAKALQKVGKEITMIATDIIDVNDSARSILQAASSLGIKYYRTGYFSYDDTKSIIAMRDEYKHKIERIERMNRTYGIHGCYQNHSGPYRLFGGAVWDLHAILKDTDPEFIGIQYDIMHATVEGGYVWPYGLRLVAPWIKVLAIKDFVWAKNDAGKWREVMVPLGEGMVDFKAYVKEIKHLNIPTLFTMHSMYDLGGAELGSRKPNMSPQAIKQKLRKDLLFLKDLQDRY